MDILAVDLGKSKSVACLYQSDSGRHVFETVPTTPAALAGILELGGPFHRPG